jgi:hypothetical protein
VKIGIAQIDGKWPNLALMKISAWHRSQNDAVHLANPIEEYDRIYASKVFDFTPDWQYFPRGELIKGGWGYRVEDALPDHIEHILPDYALFGQTKAMGFTTRGCARACDFCIVPRKEGKIRFHADISEFWNGQPEVMLMDNNLTAAPEVLERDCKFIKDHNLTVDIHQGLDARLMTDDIAKTLRSVKHARYLHFAWDSMAIEGSVLRGLEILGRHFSKERLMVFVLIGFDTTEAEDLYRVKTLHRLGYESFVMPFDKSDPYQKAFTRWCNNKFVFKSTDWNEYRYVHHKVTTK